MCRLLLGRAEHYDTGGGLMWRLNDTRTRWFCLTAAMALLTACAGVSRLHPLIREEAETHRLAQVTALATRHEMGVHYDKLIASAGIHDADPCAGSLAEGRVYCCGGPNLSIWFCVPNGIV
jgi:hypothetical protein